MFYRILALTALSVGCFGQIALERPAAVGMPVWLKIPLDSIGFLLSVWLDCARRFWVQEGGRTAGWPNPANDRELDGTHQSHAATAGMRETSAREKGTLPRAVALAPPRFTPSINRAFTKCALQSELWKTQPSNRKIRNAGRANLDRLDANRDPAGFARSASALANRAERSGSHHRKGVVVGFLAQHRWDPGPAIPRVAGAVPVSPRYLREAVRRSRAHVLAGSGDKSRSCTVNPNEGIGTERLGHSNLPGPIAALVF